MVARRHDAAARIQAAVRAKTARERVGKMRAEERVAAAKARVARNVSTSGSQMRTVQARQPRTESTSTRGRAGTVSSVAAT